MRYLPLNEALSEMAIRVFATQDWMANRYAELVSRLGDDNARSAFNREALVYGIQIAG